MCAATQCTCTGNRRLSTYATAGDDAREMSANKQAACGGGDSHHFSLQTE